MTIAFDPNENTIRFYTEDGRVSTLDFSGEKITFKGDADFAAEEFINRLEGLYVHRFKVLKELENK